MADEVDVGYDLLDDTIEVKLNGVVLNGK